MYKFFLQSVIQRRVQKYNLHSDQKLLHLKENGTYNFSSSHTAHWLSGHEMRSRNNKWFFYMPMAHVLQIYTELKKKVPWTALGKPHITVSFFSIRFSYLWSTYYLFKYTQHCSNGKTRPQHHSFTDYLKFPFRMENNYDLLTNERPTWCHLLFYFTYSVLNNMFRTLIYPSSGVCDCVDELPHRSSCSQFVVCWSFWCGWFLVVFVLQAEAPTHNELRTRQPMW